MNSKTNYKEIPGFVNLEVNEIGQIRRVGSESHFECSVSNSGYFQTKVNGQQIRCHRAVLLAHKGVPTESNAVGNHIDGNKRNNSLSNLEWVSSRENTSHAIRKTTKTSKYIGVCWSAQRGKWKTSIHLNGKQVFLGYHTSEDQAGKAYTDALNDNGETNRYSEAPRVWEKIQNFVSTKITNWSC